MASLLSVCRALPSLGYALYITHCTLIAWESQIQIGRRNRSWQMRPTLNDSISCRTWDAYLVVWLRGKHGIAQLNFLTSEISLLIQSTVVEFAQLWNFSTLAQTRLIQIEQYSRSWQMRSALNYSISCISTRFSYVIFPCYWVLFHTARMSRVVNTL